ncbi:sensor histidine kinase [Paenibacillus durus]|uniref:histidine kinase n=1 Tax=Paenibacillus durus ATCC 35681 TaxID=1333534 RepID=A0A0F7F8Z0_PAEDU|nr:HAMP domain-containing sensor histidine kinase [Paenibacillus durus]AKG34878.1 histidine kinase [Paenibacillus durus ATCC 35681]
MKKTRLFYTLLKSYIIFALTMGIVNGFFLFIFIEPTNIEITLDWLLLFILLFGLNVWAYSLWTANRITKPLEKIAQAIQHMKEGRYQQRLEFEAGYEFSLIQQHLNDMAANLAQAQENNRRLETGRQRMLVDISHDLKTPITTIQGYAKALELGYAENDTQRDKYLHLIYNKATFVTELIEDIFSLSKLDSPDYPLSLTPADLAELIREISAEYYDQFEDKKIKLEVDVPSAEVIIPFDSKIMRRAISNLVANAMLHNPPQTKVKLSLKETRDTAALYISDNGNDIPNELKDVIFDPFVRGDAARRSDGGTGLGLAIAKKAAELHGGKLELNNTPGQKTFILTLCKNR